jgi:hypothetical protein
LTDDFVGDNNATSGYPEDSVHKPDLDASKECTQVHFIQELSPHRDVFTLTDDFVGDNNATSGYPEDSVHKPDLEESKECTQVHFIQKLSTHRDLFTLTHDFVGDSNATSRLDEEIIRKPDLDASKECTWVHCMQNSAHIETSFTNLILEESESALYPKNLAHVETSLHWHTIPSETAMQRRDKPKRVFINLTLEELRECTQVHLSKKTQPTSRLLYIDGGFRRRQQCNVETSRRAGSQT